MQKKIVENRFGRLWINVIISSLKYRKIEVVIKTNKLELNQFVSFYHVFDYRDFGYALYEVGSRLKFERTDPFIT